MRTSPRSAGTGSSAPAPGAAAARRAALLGLAVVLLYLAGSGVSGSLSPLARRPLLDGLAPRPGTAG